MELLRLWSNIPAILTIHAITPTNLTVDTNSYNEYISIEIAVEKAGEIAVDTHAIVLR